MKKLLLTCLLCLFSTTAIALEPKDLLPPDEAFKFSAETLDAKRIRLTWHIAAGYYLYRNKFQFTSQTPAITLQPDAATFPAGKIKHEPDLGELEVYHNSIAIDVPLERAADAQQAITMAVQATYQGCSEMGICYAPLRKTANLQLAALGTEAVATTTVDFLTEELPSRSSTASTSPAKPSVLNSIRAAKSETTLPVEQAFQYTLVALDRHTLVAHWEVTPDHHLYKSKIKFTIKSPEGARLGTALFPAAKQVDDEFFGPMEVFTASLDASIPVQWSGDVGKQAETLVVETEYQGCSDKTGVCYPPVIQETLLDLAGLPAKADTAQLSKAADATASASQQPLYEASTQQGADDYYNRMQSASLFGTIASFFGIGLLLAFTPCIFPMIPILSGVIVGQTDLSTRKAFLLSLAYVLASASAYSIIGIFFGIFGENLQAILQHPIAIASFAGLFVLLALSMFGFYELQMPNSLQSRINELSNRQRGGSLMGAAIMGFLSTLIVGPCVAPPLAGALTYIAQTKDAFIGGAALFSMGFAMGLPLLLVGTSAGHLMPRAGAWMDTTKAIFGIMMLGLAIWMLDRIVSLPITMALTGILLVASGIHMGALDRLDGESSGWRRFWKSTGLIMLFYGALQLLGVALGSHNLLQPLHGFFASSPSAALSQPAQALQKSVFERVRSLADLERALADAKANQQLAVLDFYADWCTDCIRMEKSTLASMRVSTGLAGIKLLKADVTAQNKEDAALQKQFGVIGPPTMVFFDKNNNEIKNLRLIGYENEANFLARLQRLPSR